MNFTSIVLLLTGSTSLFAQPLKPLLNTKKELLLEDHFDNGKHSEKWKFIHGTQFKVEDGVLVGRPSSKEFQEKKKGKGHSGGTPSSHLLVESKDSVIEMSFKISGKMKGIHVGWNDGSFKTGTGHVARVTYSKKDGVSIVKDRNVKKEGDETQLLLGKPFELKSDTWYHIMIEVRGDELLAQIQGGPTVYAKHARFDIAKTHLNLPTRGGGEVYYDNVKIWSAIANPKWEQNRSTIDGEK